MATFYNPNLVVDGLVFAIDAANIKSYSGTGVTVNGLVGGIGGTFIGGSGFSAGNYGSFYFNGTTNYIISNAITQNNNASALTWTAWVKRNASNSLMTFMQYSATNSDIGLELWSNSVIYFEIGNPSNTYGELSNNSTSWQNVTMVFDGSGVGNSSRLNAYINGIQQNLTYTGTIPSTAGSGNTLYIGNTGPFAVWNSNLFSAGNLGSFQSYNRALSAAEILQNFNALRGRYGV
jgi:hypothetical protein